MEATPATANPEMAPGPPGKRPTDKLKKFDWELVDKAGVFLMIPKAQLKVDQKYQRDAVHPKVIAIARSWSWIACGVLIVADRGPKGGFYVVDGQHRKLAADNRSDIKELPCMVFEAVSVPDEAQAFLRVNANRKPLTSYQRFGAQLTAGDETAKKVDRLLNDIGRKVGSHHGRTQAACVGTLMQCVTIDEKAFLRIWPLVVELCKKDALNGRLIDGLFWLERNAAEGMSLSDPYWTKVLLQIGAKGLLSAAAKFGELHGKSGPRYIGAGMLVEMHKSRQKRFLELSV